MNLRQSLAIVAAACAVAEAATSTAWEMTSYKDFVAGRFTGLALGKDGRLRLGPQLETVFSAEESAVWSVARAADGATYLGTGMRGKLFRVNPGGKSELIWTAGEAAIFAVALDSRGRVFAATSPAGKVYRIERNRAVEHFAPGAQYIWALAPAADGSLYVGTGGEGKLYRVSPEGRGELYYDTGQSHVVSLAMEGAGSVLAGTEPNGILYRVTGRDRAFVLHDADLPEIRALAVQPDGTIYAAAMGGSLARQVSAAPATAAPSSGGVTVSAPAVSITVTEDALAQQPGVEVKPAAPAPVSPAGGLTTAAAAPPEITGVEKSAIYRIRPDHLVEKIWSSKEENVYDLVPDGASLLIATDNHGRLYRVDGNRKVTLVAETREREALRLVAAPGGTLVATGNAARLYRLTGAPAPKGEYESPVHDALAASRWGRLAWRVEGCPGCEVALRTRTGNSARPDRTWSDWSEPVRDPTGSPVASPNARFVQWRAELTSAGAASPVLGAVRLAYLPPNTTPEVRSITVSAQTASAGARAATGPGAAASATYSVTVTDTGETAASSAGGTPTQPLTRASREQLLVSWAAEDADGDKLVFRLEVRGEDERDWKLVKDHLSESSYTVEAEALADGRYTFRVIASDRSGNPPEETRESDLESAPVLVDRTPPVIRAAPPARNGARWEAALQVSDATSPLRSCEYALDGGPWSPLNAVDGVIDSETEDFRLRLEGLAPGEHVVVVRAYDAANNAGLWRAVLR